MAADARAIIANIYSSELGREADPEGLNFYIGEFQKGKTADQIRAEISASREGAAFDARSAADTVSALFQRELGRAADPEGLSFYSGMLSQGKTAEEIRQMLNASEEGRVFDTAAVNRAYQDQLGRSADPEGLNTYLNLVQQGYDQNEIERLLNASEEGRRYDESVLEQGYKDVLGRTSDPTGRQYWLGRMREDVNIDPTTLNAYLEGGRTGTDVRATTLTPTTITPSTTTPTTLAPTTTTPTTTTPTTIGPTLPGGTRATTNAGISGLPGAGIEQLIASGALPQNVTIGGAPVTIGGGFAAYPYATQAFADQLGIPMLKLQEIISASMMPSNLVAAPTGGGYNFQQITNPTFPFVSPIGAAGNPYATTVYGTPFTGTIGGPTGGPSGGVPVTNPVTPPPGG